MLVNQNCIIIGDIRPSSLLVGYLIRGRPALILFEGGLVTLLLEPLIIFEIEEGNFSGYRYEGEQLHSN